MKEFTQERINRYSRSIILKQIGIEGQIKISESKVLIIGAGALGSPSALYLASSGVGTIGIADYDKVEISNLQRQIIHSLKDIGKLKPDSAETKINDLNPDVYVKKYNLKIDSDNINEIIEEYDFIIDATDGLSVKLMINDSCVINNKPFVHSGILGMQGQLVTVIPHKSACLRCILGNIDTYDNIQTCSNTGIFPPLAGIFGSFMASEALKYILNGNPNALNKIIAVNLDDFKIKTITTEADSSCAVCGKEHSVKKPAENSSFSCRK